MDLNMIGLAVGKVEAEQRGLEPPDSTRIGVLSALMPNTLMSFVISRSLADRQVADQQVAPVTTDGGQNGGTTTTTTTTATATPSSADIQQAVAEALKPLGKTLEAMQAALEKIGRQLAKQPPKDPVAKGPDNPVIG